MPVTHDVRFGFDNYKLSDEAKAALDAFAANKCLSAKPFVLAALGVLPFAAGRRPAKGGRRSCRQYPWRLDMARRRRW